MGKLVIYKQRERERVPVLVKVWPLKDAIMALPVLDNQLPLPFFIIFGMFLLIGTEAFELLIMMPFICYF